MNIPWIKTAFALGATLLSFSSLAVQAADFNVTRVDDPVPDACDSGVDCSLREAIIAARTSPDAANQINLPAGTYTLTQPGSNEDLAVDGDLDILDRVDAQEVIVSTNLTLQGAGAKSTIIDGSATGERVFHIKSEGTGVTFSVSLNDLTIQGGQAKNGDGTISGGGIFAQALLRPGRANLALHRCHVTANETTLFGGGLDVEEFDNVLIDHSAFTANTADSGGAISANNINDFKLLSSTVSGNEAVRFIGGLRFTGNNLSATTVSLFNSTIAHNSAALAIGGIKLEGFFEQGESSENPGTPDVELITSNTIIASNSAPENADCQVQDDTLITSLGYNIVGDTSDCLFPLNGVGDQPDTDPGLLALADNGGPTPTHEVPPASPAYNLGNPDACANGEAVGPTSDQRGQDRVADGNCEIGAYEKGSANLKVAKSVDKTEAEVGDELTYTITVTNLGPNTSFNTVIKDSLPAGLNFLSVTLSGVAGICNEAGGEITCNIDQLKVDEVATITVKVIAAAPGLVVNLASSEGSEDDPDPDDNSSSVEVTVDDGVVPPPPVVVPPGTLEGSGVGCQLNVASSASLNLLAYALLVGCLGLSLKKLRN